MLGPNKTATVSFQVSNVAPEGFHLIQTDPDSGVSIFYSSSLRITEIPDEVPDTDSDGVADDNDQCPNSDLRDTVWIGGCDSGVSNDIDGVLVDADGCSLADQLAHQLTTAATGARNHGRFVSALARYLNTLVHAGIIDWTERQALMNCIGSANRSDFLLP